MISLLAFSTNHTIFSRPGDKSLHNYMYTVQALKAKAPAGNLKIELFTL